VQLLHRKAGRGPTRAKSYWAGEDVLVVVLGEGFTDVETTLVERGRAETALAYRHAVQAALEGDMSAEVERLTSRRVVATMSCAHHDPDLLVEIFVLERLEGSEAPEPTMRGAADQAAPLPGPSPALDGSL
jgi:hypothetical protein